MDKLFLKKFRVNLFIFLRYACFLPICFFLIFRPAFATQLKEQLIALSDVTRFTPDKALPVLLKVEIQARSAEPDTKAEFFEQLTMTRLRLFQLRDALTIADEAVNDAIAGKNEDAFVKSHLTKALVLAAMHKNDASYEMVLFATKKVKNDTNIKLQIEALLAEGQVWSNRGHFPNALLKLLRALELARTIGPSPILARTLHAVAHLYDKMHDYTNGFAILKEQLNVSRQLNSEGWLAIAKINEFSLERSVGNTVRAEKALLDALVIARRIGAKTLIVNSLINLSDCMLNQRYYSRAKSYSLEAMKLAQESANRASEAVARANLGLVYLGMGMLNEGKKQSEIGLGVWEADGNQIELQSALVQYGSALERVGDHVGALAVYHRERSIANILFEKQRMAAVAEVQQKYQLNQKQNQIKLLRQENLVKNTEIAAKTLQHYVLLLLLLVVFLILVIVALVHRRLRKDHTELTGVIHDLEIKSSKDPLTNLYNRRYFQEFIHDRQKVMEVRSGAIFLIDLDHFKQINDQYGHEVGDSVLRAIANTLMEVFREADMIVRWGGEEFLVFVPSVSDVKIEVIAQRVLQEIFSQKIPYYGGYLSVSASMGCAPFPLHYRDTIIDWKRLVNLIDMALYLAKKQGRNRACYIAGFSSVVNCKLEYIEQNLERAWKSGCVKLKILIFDGILKESNN